jgi:hypothetical protein
MRRKAFVFTLEAVIGVLIGSSILTGFFAFYDLPTQQTTLHQRTATDALYILDEENILTGTPDTDEQDINDTLNSVIPPEFQYRFNVTYFNVAGGTVSATGEHANFSTLSPKSNVIYDVRPILIFDRSGNFPQLDKIARVKIGVAQ